MESYQLMVHFLGAALGPDYEIVLTDAMPSRQCVIAIANGHVSGRNVGAPLTDFTLQIIDQQLWKNQDHLTRYSGTTGDGRALISSTFFIKAEGKLLGTLCINHDASLYREMAEKLLKLGGVITTSLDIEPAREYFFDDVDGYVDSIINDFFDGSVPEHFTQAHKIDIIQRFNARGLFQLKGTINMVAERFNCSKATIYRYLSMFRNDNNTVA